MALWPTELIFVRKIRSVFDILLRKENKKPTKEKKLGNPIYQEKTFFSKSIGMLKKFGRVVSLINVSGD